MPALDYVALLRSDSAALAAAADVAGLDAPIPSCPNWTMADLLDHLGRIHAAATEVARTRAMIDFTKLPPMPTGGDLLPAFRDRAAALADALDALPLDEPVWNWFGLDPPPPAFYHRRLAQETAVHRWDAETTIGRPRSVDAELAADGIDELLAGVLVWRSFRADLGGSIHVHATDADSEWVIENVDGRLATHRGHEKCTVAARGPVSDLLLFLWGRIPSDELEVIGDPAPLSAWAEAIKV